MATLLPSMTMCLRAARAGAWGSNSTGGGGVIGRGGYMDANFMSSASSSF